MPCGWRVGAAPPRVADVNDTSRAFDDNDTACLYVSGAAGGDNLGAAHLLFVVYVVRSLTERY